jgi:MFS family permease
MSLLRLHKPRVYYGWVIVATMSVVTMAQTAEFNPVLGVFLKPMTEEFGWSRSEFTGAIAIGTICGGLAAMVVGPLLDRFGPRWVLFFGFLAMGGTIAGLAGVDRLWQFYILMASSRILVSGVISIATGVVISKWFIRRRGRAMALATTGTRIGNALMPLYVQTVLGLFGWRSAALALGAFTWAITLLPTSLLLRRQPEDMGLLPDGDSPRDAAGRQAADGTARVDSPPEASFTLREALRTRAFYLVLFVTASLFFIGAGVNFNLFPYLTDQGISPSAAVTVISTWSLVSAVGGLAMGVIAERVHVRIVMSGAIFLVGLGIFILSIADSLGTAYLFALVHGLTFGGIPMLQQLVWADYFGRRSQGAIRGFVTPVQMTANAFGPLTAAFVFDQLGSYVPIFRVYILIYVVASVAIFLAKPPAQRAVREPAEAVGMRR